MENDNVKINLELNVNGINVVLTALLEMPYRAVNDLINNVASLILYDIIFLATKLLIF